MWEDCGFFFKPVCILSYPACNDSLNNILASRGISLFTGTGIVCFSESDDTFILDISCRSRLILFRRETMSHNSNLLSIKYEFVGPFF